jgi:hypothetical protein
MHHRSPGPVGPRGSSGDGYGDLPAPGTRLSLSCHWRRTGEAWAVNGRRSPPVRRMLLAAAGPAVLAAGGCTTHAFVAQLPVGRTPASFPDRAGLATLAAHAIALTEQRLRRTRRRCSLGEAVVTTSADGTARVTARRCEAGTGIDRAGHQPLPIRAYTGHAGVATALLRERRRDQRQARDRKCGEAGAPRAGERTLAAGRIRKRPLPPAILIADGRIPKSERQVCHCFALAAQARTSCSSRRLRQ